MEQKEPNLEFFNESEKDDNININGNKNNANINQKINNNCNNNNNNQYSALQELKLFYNIPKDEENSSEVSLENIDEDLYTQELYIRLSQMKQERKKAEENAKLLDNRLNLLKSEEIKTLKNIELTKKKANDKFQNLQFLLQNKNIKNEAKKKKEKDLIQKKQQNKLMISKIKNNTAMNKAKLKKQIEEEAKLLKIQKIYNKQLISFLNEEKMNANKAKCNNIKSEKKFFNEKKRMNNIEKKRKLREELEKKLIEEYKLKEDAENKRFKAEKEESEIIKKLQNTTQLQQNIKNEYEKMNINSIMRGEYDNYNNINNSYSSNNRKNNKKSNIKIK